MTRIRKNVHKALAPGARAVTLENQEELVSGIDQPANAFLEVLIRVINENLRLTLSYRGPSPAKPF